jgi:hypothetical protein
MKAMKTLMIVSAIALAGSATAGDTRYQPVAQLQGVWLTQVEIRDCISDSKLAGPFPGIISFQAGGTVGESGPALPNSQRGAGFGVWRRTGRDTFAQTLTFQRFDVTGIYLGTQLIRGTPRVAADSMSFVAAGGTYEVRDARGNPLGAPGCSFATGVRLQ